MVSTAVAMRAVVNVFTEETSGEMQCGDHDVDSLDADERNNHAAEAVDKKIASQNRGRADWTITHAAQRQRYQRDDDQRVENYCRQNSTLRRRQMHHVEPLQFWILDDEQRRDDREVLGDVVGDRERRERAARH